MKFKREKYRSHIGFYYIVENTTSAIKEILITRTCSEYIKYTNYLVSTCTLFITSVIKCTRAAVKIASCARVCIKDYLVHVV